MARCEIVANADEKHTTQCQKGVYDSFIGMGLGHEYGLSFDADSFSRDCGEEPGERKTACYSMAASKVGSKTRDPEHVLAKANAATSQPEYQKILFESGIAAITQDGFREKDFSRIFAGCRTLSRAFLGPCVDSIVKGIVNVDLDMDQTQETARGFCSSSLIEEERMSEACFHAILYHVKRLYSPAHTATVCRMFPKPFQECQLGS